MRVHFVLWKWTQPGSNRAYLPEHVNTMCRMLRRNLVNVNYRLLLITDDASGVTECETAALWPDCEDMPNASGKHLPSCYRRLKLYDKVTQESLGIEKGDRIVGLDLDSLVTGQLHDLLETKGLFVGWHLMNYRQEYVFNGSFQMFSAGTLQDIWSDFNPRRSPKEAAEAGYRGSDQAWLSYKLVKRPGAVGLDYPLVASYPLHNRIRGELKADTRIIFFHGSQKPWDPDARKFTRWIDRYWRD